MLRYWFSVKILNLNLKIHFLLRCFNYSADNHDFMREYWKFQFPNHMISIEHFFIEIMVLLWKKKLTKILV